MNSSCVQVFAKSPIPGKIKTRLQPALSADDCAKLSATMIRHSVRVACELEDTDVQLWCFPNTSQPFFETLAEEFPIELIAQQGSNIGERMNFALQRGLEWHRSVQLIGSDCPFYCAEYLLEGFRILETDRQLVLGPAEDGGYLLIGCNWEIPSNIFDNITWGTDSVFRETVDKMNARGITPKLLPKMSDIDRPEDLLLFR